jgi:hypothetical protein
MWTITALVFSMRFANSIACMKRLKEDQLMSSSLVANSKIRCENFPCFVLDVDVDIDQAFAMEVVRQGYECWRLGCETNWDIGNKNPEFYFKWFSKRVENLIDADGPLAEVARRGKK